MDNFTNTQSVRIAEIERRLDAIEHRLKSLGTVAASAAASAALSKPSGDDRIDN